MHAPGQRQPRREPVTDAFVHVSVQQGGDREDQVLLVARVDPRDPPERADQVWLARSETDLVHVLDPGSGQRVSA